MNNNNNIIRQYQEKLMAADPFLLESISSKTTDELTALLTKLQNQLAFMARQSPSWQETHRKTIDIIECIIHLRMIQDNDGGGVSII